MNTHLDKVVPTARSARRLALGHSRRLTVYQALVTAVNALHGDGMAEQVLGGYRPSYRRIKRVPIPERLPDYTRPGAVRVYRSFGDLMVQSSD